ncbi:MAG: hypothetical protein JWN85_3398 [Gammaproteobacteria bacterium]|nr:hypothetical protein [Gammaproteobacteria bacterium]
MRLFGLMFAALCSACLNTTYAYAQGAQAHPAEEQHLEPYRKHRDVRHGHNHSYPDRGSVIRDLPRGTIGVNYAGVSYRFHDGVWLEPRGPAFIVVAPPIGLVVPNLPSFTTVLAHGGQTYLYVNDVYYRPRPDLSGYEVVNDPVQTPSQAKSETFTGGRVPSTAATASEPESAQVTTPSTAPAAFPVMTPTAPVSAASAGFSGGAAATTPMDPGAGATPPSAGPVATPPVAAAALSNPPTAGPVAMNRLAAAAAAHSASPSTTAAPVEATSGTPSALVFAPTTSAPTPNAPAALATGTSSAPPPTSKGSKLFVYPRNGQNSDQQARDRYDCYRFAVAQSGFDPMHPAGAVTQPNAELQSDFDRAQGACFDARGYTSR